MRVKCPHCGEVHAISVREAYIKFAVQDGTDPIVVDRLPPRADLRGFSRAEPPP